MVMRTKVPEALTENGRDQERDAPWSRRGRGAIGARDESWLREMLSRDAQQFLEEQWQPSGE
jgi:hypothetical protein